MCWQHARSWRHRWISLTRNQTIIFVMGVLALVAGIPSAWFAFDSWWQSHPKAVQNTDHVEVSPSKLESKTIHRMTFTSPKDGWMTQWGGSPPNIVWAVVNGFDLGPAKGKFRYILLCRIDDPTIDEQQDTTIEHSVAFAINPESFKIGIPTSQSFIARTISPKMVWIYLLLLPNTVQPEQIRTLSDVDRLGGGLLVKNGFQWGGNILVIRGVRHS